MSEILLESDFLTVDLRSIFNNNTNSETTSANDTANSEANNSQQTKAPAVGPDAELEQKLLALKFPEDIIKKLLAFGEPFKKACRVLGFEIKPKKGSNPILAFIHQNWVQANLISTNLLNVNTFKAIYNAVAKRLVADSEFFKVNGYNIIYCPDLYKKPAKEIEEYLKAQSNILKSSAVEYDEKIQLKNRQVFLRKTSKNKIPKVLNAELNSLNTIKQLGNSSTENNTIHRDQQELADIVKKLSTISEKFAAILSLSTSTKSTKAKSALSNTRLEVSGQELANAFIKLSSENILPKGQLQADDADALVDMILATLKNGAGAQ
jgi:hypothetical protein